MSRSVGKTIVIDTSVLVEYLLEDSPYLKRIEELLQSSKREYNLVTIPQVIAEILYVASRLYRESGEDSEEANLSAIEYLRWLRSVLRIVNVKDVAVQAGELKKNYRISLTDCYVIASARNMNGSALFLKPEVEMLPVLDQLKDLGVLFLQDLK